MKYGDKIIKMEGIIVEVHDEGIGVDLMGRLGYLLVPMRMVISDTELKVGQRVAWNMSFIEQEGPEVDHKYISNIDARKRRSYQDSTKLNYEEE